MSLKPEATAMKIGDKIKIPGERQRYTVQAFDERYVIMTKPINVLRTYIYIIVDKKENRRGPDNCIFTTFRHDMPVYAELALKALQSGEIEVSSIRRRGKELEPEVLEQLR